MESSSGLHRRIAVIGGGITGLAAAHRLRELSPEAELVLYEAQDRLGGVIHTEHRDGYLVEHGADMFTTKQPWALELCRRIGIEDQLIGTNDRRRRAFVIRRGRLCPVPAGFTLMSPARTWPVLKSPVLSWRGKLRLGCERFVARRDSDTDESLASFATRRLGREVYERLVQPLIGGIYTADPEQLSMQAALPEFVELERAHGSLTRAMKQQARSSRATESGARYGMFLAPRAGFRSLIDALADRLGETRIRLSTPIETVTRQADDRWQVTPAGCQPATYDAVVMATPAHHAARLLEPINGDVATDLREIRYASAAIAAFGYRREQVAHALDGFGFVAPLIEQRRILAGSFSSVKFDGRAPDGRVLLRVFVGGACQAELLDHDDEALIDLVRDELADLIGVSGTPEFAKLVRWNKAMPQYHLGHVARVERIENRLADIANLELAGNAYRGVGIPFSIHSGEQAAERLLQSSS